MIVDKITLINELKNSTFTYDRTKKRYQCDTICCFDTETTSYRIDEDKKIAFVYAYIISVNDKVTIVRDINELIDIFLTMSRLLDLDKKERILIFWTHNLKFDFQFIRKYFEWESVFAIKSRSVVEAITSMGIGFRCTYLMTGKSLEAIGKNLSIQKMVGDLDYSKVRLPSTPLIEEELRYMEHDVLIIYELIKDELKTYGKITKLPITNTQRVRNYVRERCFSEKDYKKFIQGLELQPMDYALLHEAFAGGFAHAGIFYSCRTVTKVASYDITSDYPTIMVAEKFPMSIPFRQKVNSFDEYKQKYRHKLSVMRVQISGLEEKIKTEHILSFSKCIIDGKEGVDYECDNGRLVWCKKLITSITNLDLESIMDFYTFDNIEFLEFMFFKKGYLPKPIIESVLDFYEKKTTLKGLDGEDNEKEYMLSKNMLNAIYGMMVTDLLRKTIIYTKEHTWTEEELTSKSAKEKLHKANTKANKFLYYAWGVFVTAYARRRLLRAIKYLSIYYAYSDTDSVKFKDFEHSDRYFKNEDFIIKRQVKRSLLANHIPYERAFPKTVKGVVKPLGVWEKEGIYDRFKALGAKRYIYEVKGEPHLTVAGVPKKAVEYFKYMKETRNLDAFDLFKDNLVIPAKFSHKNASVYIDDEMEADVIDYNGVKQRVNSPSGLFIEPIDATLSLSDMYISFLLSFDSCGELYG